MEDYVNEVPLLKTLYNRPHKRESYGDQIKEKASHSVNREVLVRELHRQYSHFDLEKSYPKVFENIESLSKSNAFTVTTGHQLCLFTGPLYFIYKIVNTILLAEQLSAQEDAHVVPVFWMATEDHDFEEVNHVWYGDLKYEWKRDSGNAVGRMSTDGIEEVIAQLSNVVEKTPSTSELLDIFKRCYRSGQSLAEATRELATQLFGDKGLVVIDADSRELKRCATEVFKADLIEGIHNEVLNSSANVLDEKYFTQVNPREVNLFYLDDHARYRIEKKEEHFISIDGPYTWTKEEILGELSLAPERFSPNVILRPVYQEIILPNLAYIGGGGELAYWLQLKGIFDHHDIPFPILRLRNSVGFIRKKYWHKMDSLGLSLDEVCSPVFEQRRSYYKEKYNLNGELAQLKAKADELHREMFELADNIDESLKGTANAYQARQLHLLENFEKKILRSIQRREEETTRMFEEIHGEIFPSGGLQERRDTWLTIVERFGSVALDELYSDLDPFAHDFSWIVE